MSEPSKKQKEINTITEHVLKDKMQEVRLRLSNGNTFGFMGRAIATRGEVNQGLQIEDFDIYTPEENDEGELIQGIRIYLPDGRIGDFIRKYNDTPLVTEEDIEQGVQPASMKFGFPEDITDEIRGQVVED